MELDRSTDAGDPAEERVMSQVEITFMGICVHMSNLLLRIPVDGIATGRQGGDSRTRWAILPDARQGRRLDGTLIACHLPLLVIPEIFIESVSECTPGLRLLPGLREGMLAWEMCGVDLYVRHATDPLDDSALRELPSLTRQSDALSLELDRRVVVEGRAAARFGIFGGTIHVRRYDKLALVTLTVQTSDGPTLKLMLTRDDTKHGAIQLKRANGQVPQVVVTNYSWEGADHSADFNLNYDVVTRIPLGVVPPSDADLASIRKLSDEKSTTLKWILGDPGSGLGAGCSNSDFP